ncbi:hypothetical protein LMG9673_03670 [Ralstonia pseudosolanacearum]|nr:hypothetical protein LMG9673_03670 [Ralstonia pseudosolanacearum]
MSRHFLNALFGEAIASARKSASGNGRLKS